MDTRFLASFVAVADCGSIAEARKAGIRPKDRYELDGLELIAVMVDRGLGVTLLPDWAPPWPEGLSLRKLALPDRSPVRRTGLLWNRASLRARLVRALLERAQFALGHRGTAVGRRNRRTGTGAQR
jgi:DNA-binding transcriptional LysR family regulator